MKPGPAAPADSSPAADSSPSGSLVGDAPAVDLDALLRQPAPEVLRVLGRGAQGVVYARRDAALQRDLASKELDLRRASAASVARFVREARVLARLDHPGVPPLYALGRTGDTLYMHMRWAQGRPLSELIAEHPDSNTRLRALVPALASAARTLAAAHRRGVIHRDVKPDHILVGELGEVAVVDWGLARLVDEAEPPGSDEPAPGHLTQLGARLGTPGYWSPEQADGRAAEAGPSADLWSLGRVLQHLIEGGPPDASPPTRGPDELRSVVAAALRQGPAYRDAAAFAADLDAWRAGEPVSAHTYTMSQRGLRAAQRNVRGMAIGAVILGLGGLLGATLYTQRAQARHATDLWTRTQVRGWVQRSTPRDPAWTALAGALDPARGEDAQRMGMILDFEAQDRPRLLDRLVIPGASACVEHRLSLPRDGALCFGDETQRSVLVWAELPTEPSAIGMHGAGGYIAAMIAADRAQILLDTGDGVEVWTLRGERQEKLTVPDLVETATLSGGTALLRDATAAWARGPDGATLWRIEDVAAVVPFEKHDEALLVRRTGALIHATARGASELRCTLPPQRSLWQIAASGWLVRGLDTSAIELLDLGTCDTTLLSVPFEVQDIALDPERQQLAISSPEGEIEVRNLRESTRRRLVLPGGATSLSFEPGGVLQVAQQDGLVWRFATDRTRGRRVDAGVTDLIWQDHALLVQTSAATWRVPVLDDPDPDAAGLAEASRLDGRTWPWRDGWVTVRDGELHVSTNGARATAPAFTHGGVTGDALYLLGETLSALRLPDLEPLWRAVVPPGTRALQPGRDGPLLARDDGVQQLGPEGPRELWRGPTTGAWESPDGGLYVADGGAFDLIEVRGGAGARTIASAGSAIADVAWAAGRMATAGNGGVGIWQHPDAISLATVRSNRLLTAAALSPDGRWLATGDAHGLVQIWDLSWLDLDAEAALERVRAWSGLDVIDGEVVPWAPDQP